LARLDQYRFEEIMRANPEGFATMLQMIREYHGAVGDNIREAMGTLQPRAQSLRRASDEHIGIHEDALIEESEEALDDETAERNAKAAEEDALEKRKRSVWMQADELSAAFRTFQKKANPRRDADADETSSTTSGPRLFWKGRASFENLESARISSHEEDFDSDGEKKPKKEDSDDGDGSARNTLKMDQKRSIHFGSHLEDDDDGF
jgi:hypothetical protein